MARNEDGWLAVAEEGDATTPVPDLSPGSVGPALASEETRVAVTIAIEAAIAGDSCPIKTDMRRHCSTCRASSKTTL